jgi:hypothetical protein
LHFGRESEAEVVDKGYEAGPKDAFGGGAVLLDRPCPHVVIVDHLGRGPKTGGTSFSPLPLNLEPWFMTRWRRSS